MSAASTTSRLSRKCCTMYCDKSARLARSRSFWRTRSSLFAHAGREHAGGGGNGEQHHAQKPGGRIDSDVAVTAELLPDRVHENRDRGDGGQEQRTARRQQKREAADRHRAARGPGRSRCRRRRAAAASGKRCRRRLNDGLDVRARQAPAHQDDACESEAEIAARRPEKSCGDSTGRPREPPREYRPRSTSGTRTRYRFRIPSTRQLSPILDAAAWLDLSVRDVHV